jgi:hypothetical protein
MSYKFPSDIAKLAARPFIKFSCKNATIILPIPGSLQFSDGVTYNNAELGFLGGSLSRIAAAGSNAQTFGAAAGNAGNELAKIYAEGKNKLANMPISAMIQGLTAVSGAGENIQNAISIGTGTTLNKNITTEFTSVDTRAFTFAFQLVPSSVDEAATIKNIVKAFRENLYPEGDDLQLYYPPKWKIQFRKGGEGEEITDIPKIGDVYLKEVSTSFNSTANMWRADGSPIETTLQLQFMETKAYRKDTLPK